MYGQAHIHLVGIGGVGMASIAEVLLTQGYTVSGSDLKDSPVLRRLRSLGGQVYVGHDATHVHGADVVAVSSAVVPDNPEWIEAGRTGIPVVPRAELLAELMRTKYGVAVAGAHGKTTTTSMVASVLAEGGLDPTVIVGGRILDAGSGAISGLGDYMVAEADESDGSFLRLMPAVAVVTNIDREHIQHFGTMAALEAAFLEFVDRVPFYGAAILCVDDPAVARLAGRAARRVRTYGLSAGAEVQAAEVTASGTTVRYTTLVGGRRVGDIVLGMPGRHNIQNSLAAVAVGLEFGLPFAVVRDGLAQFGGVSRRFEVRGEHGGTILVDDYGHHPTEVAAVLATARATWPDHRLVCVFQPHRYTRTADLLDEFAGAFGAADRVIVCPIYPAGEAPIDGVTAAHLARVIAAGSGVEVSVARDLEAAAAAIDRQAGPGEVWMTLGAGDVGRLAEGWIEARSPAALGGC